MKKFEEITVLIAVDDYGGNPNYVTGLDSVLAAIRELDEVMLIDYSNPVDKVLVDKEEQA
jgi:hypothetical protein